MSISTQSQGASVLSTETKKFGHFTINRQNLIFAKSKDIVINIHLGSGSFSDAYLVRYKSNKAVLKTTVRSEIRKGLLEKEMIVSNILKEQTHENVVQIIDFFDNYNKTQVWFLMPWIDGEDMFERLGNLGTPFPESVAKDYFRQLLAGLEFLHGLGIVHRDIKPSNLIIGRIENRDVVKYIDFGFAKVVEIEENKAFCDSHKGTQVFMAPEVLSNQILTYDAFKSDIYSLAIVLYQMLFYHYPFGDATFGVDNEDYRELLLRMKENLIIKYPDHITVDESVKDLIENMIRNDSEIRFGIKEILASNWLSK